MRSQPKLYICLALYFWFNFSEGRKTPVQKNHKTNHPKRITFNLKEGRPKVISESQNFSFCCFLKSPLIIKSSLREK